MVCEVPYTSVVGIPTIEHFNRCARLLWNMSSAYSGPIPAPYPAQTTPPIALPPGSSVFIYYGTWKQNQAIVVDSDSDDNGKPQSTGFKMENTALRTQLEQVHRSLKWAKDALADSHQREQPLAHTISNGSLSQVEQCPATPAMPRTIPHTPEKTLSSQLSKA